MRVLFASTGGTGHFNPLRPLVHACLRRGHDVLVSGPPSLAATVGSAGFPFREFDAPPPDELGRVWAQVPSLPYDEQNRVVLGEVFGRLNSTASLPGLRRACEEWRPDVVVRDPNEYGSVVAAELHGIPHVRVGIALALTEDLAMPLVAPPVDVLRRSVGLPADPGGEAIRRSPYLTFFPASLEDPSAPGPAVTWRARDPGWDDAPRPLPDWWPGDGAPLVYVTFGSVAGALALAAPVYTAALEAMRGLDARALLTVGNEADLDAFAAPPANVHVERWVPQSDVMAVAAVVVCHGGSGTTLGALAAGLPLVVVPMFADQRYNARRVEATGPGVTVAEPDAAALRDAVGRVLEDGAYRDGARRLAAEMRTHPPIDAVVDRLAALG